MTGPDKIFCFVFTIVVLQLWICTGSLVAAEAGNTTAATTTTTPTTSAAMTTQGPSVPPVIVSATMHSIVVTDTTPKVKFEVTVKHSPKLDAVYQLLENLRWQKTDKDKFDCDGPFPHDDLVIFKCEAKAVVSTSVGTYGIRFENSKGACYFEFEIKKENETWFTEIKIAAIVVTGVVVIVAIVAFIILCRRRRRRRRHKNVRRRPVAQNSDNGRAMSYRELEEPQMQRVPSTSSHQHQIQRNGTMPRSNSARSIPRPKPPPKPPQRSNSRSSLSDHGQQSLDDDLPAPPCACGNMESKKHVGYINMHGTVLDPQSAQIAEVISNTLQQMRPRPMPRSRTLDHDNESNLLRNRRMSRSVPSLLPVHMTMPHSNSVRGNRNQAPSAGTGRYPQYPMLPTPFMQGGSIKPSDLSSFFNNPRSVAEEDSGICQGLWETDDESEFASVSVAMEPFRRRRNSAEDVGRYRGRYLRTSLELVSDELRASDRTSCRVDPFDEVFPQHQTGSHHSHQSSSGRSSKDHKYMSMTRFYRGPPQLPTPTRGDLPDPPPPPRACGGGMDSAHSSHHYENLDGYGPESGQLSSFY